ncbi:DUF4433 domain-containing protein [Rubrobacter marinus]|uniref:DUF4433 domain-containing protein n=1 Tax=Rubrobacter marinus TaxID=2653852 RepID=A0A6G8Q1Y9_9ACTN|nr:DUF4433 domain-containing protein [Rubrobacter marinus]QIN80504.1 DUF4433 domain-containing protein [Rubrobacter marinus]
MVHGSSEDAALLVLGGRLDTPIYHFTHAKNLPAILPAGRLRCKARLPNGDQLVNVSHDNIQERRRNKQVDCEPGSILHDYVPFYFATRSPMMYVISKGGVEGYDSNTMPLIYLVSSVRRVQEEALKFVFSDGHPVVKLSRFYNNLNDLDKVDWQVMGSTMWTDTEAYPDRRRRRQAEFLVHDSFPWSAVEFLAVRHTEVKRRLDDHLAREWPDLARPVRVAPGWYYPSG